MRITSLVAVVCTAAVSLAAPFYYQPNGVFMPISLSVPAVIQQQQQQQPMQIQALNNLSAGSPAATSVSPWSIISASLFGQKKDQMAASASSGSKAPAQASPSDSAVATLTRVLTPLKFVAVSFLSGLETQLEKADPKNAANVLRGPLNDLKNYLKSVWPTAPSSSNPPSSAKDKALSIAHPDQQQQQQQGAVAKSASFDKH